MAIEERILSEISRSVERVSDSSESFRVTANQQNSNIQKIIKDISSALRSQSTNQSELSNSIDELSDQQARTAEKTAAVSDRLDESAGIQNSMLSELKGLNEGFENLSNMIMMMMMNQNQTTNTPAGTPPGGGPPPPPPPGGGNKAGLIAALGGLAAALGVGIYFGVTAENSSQADAQAVEQNALGSQTDAMLAAIKQKESGGEAGLGVDPYKSVARGPDNKPLPMGPGVGTGAYQFTDETWKMALGVTGNYPLQAQYKRANEAPPEVQDMVAKGYLEYLQEKAGGDISAVPAMWRGGENINAVRSEFSPAREATIASYEKEVMANYGQQVQQQAAAQVQTQQQTPTTPQGSQPQGTQGPFTPSNYTAFLQSIAVDKSSANKLNPDFAARLARAIQDAQKANPGSPQVSITSSYRSEEEQAQLYANYIKRPYSYNGRMYTPNAEQNFPVALPGRSDHEDGRAVDLSAGPVRDWIKKNASTYGLNTIANDPPHFSDSPQSNTGASMPMDSGVRDTPAGAGVEPSQPNVPDMFGGETTNYSTNISMDQTRISQERNLLEDLLGPIGRSSEYLQTTPQMQLMPSTRGMQFNQAAVEQSAQMAAPWVDPDAPEQQPQQQAAPWVNPDSQQMQQNQEVLYNHNDDRTISPAWHDRLFGMFSQETGGIFPSSRR